MDIEDIFNRLSEPQRRRAWSDDQLLAIVHHYDPERSLRIGKDRALWQWPSIEAWNRSFVLWGRRVIFLEASLLLTLTGYLSLLPPLIILFLIMERA